MLNLKDPFFLHSSLDEYIGPHIGNDPFVSLQKFIKYLPKEYSKILTQSNNYINDIKKFYEIINKLEIERFIGPDNIAYRLYDESIQTSCNDCDNSIMSIEHYKYIKNTIFVQLTNTSYDAFNIYIDVHIEHELNKLLENIAKKIVIDSLTKNIFLTCGYMNFDGGHAVGLIFFKDKIGLYNSGAGLNYHMIDTKAPSFPQCVVYLHRPNDILLTKFIKEIITVNKTYRNTSINVMYSIIFYFYYRNIVSTLNQQDAIILYNEIISSIDKIYKEDDYEKEEKETSPILKHIMYYNTKKYTLTVYDKSINIENIYDILAHFLINNVKITKTYILFDMSEICDGKSRYQMVNNLLNKLQISREIYDARVLVSMTPNEGFTREQYSGSCTYNSILLAVCSTNNVMNKIEDVRLNITRNLLKDVTYTHPNIYDRNIFDALEKKYATHLDILDKISMLKKIMPVSQYPSLYIYDNKISDYDEKTIQFYAKLNIDKMEYNNTPIDKQKLLFLLYDHINKDDSYLENQITINHIFRIIKICDNKDIELFYIALHRTQLSNVTMAIFNIYFLLYCLDRLVFVDYKGSNLSIKDTDKNKWLIRKTKTIEVMKKFKINIHIDDEYINDMVNMIQKYENIIPLYFENENNLDDYYIEFIRSLTEQTINIDYQYIEYNIIDYRKDNYSEIYEKLFKIKGFKSIIELLLKYLYQIEPTFKKLKMVKYLVGYSDALFANFQHNPVELKSLTVTENNKKFTYINLDKKNYNILIEIKFKDDNDNIKKFFNMKIMNEIYKIYPLSTHNDMFIYINLQQLYYFDSKLITLEFYSYFDIEFIKLYDANDNIKPTIYISEITSFSYTMGEQLNSNEQIINMLEISNDVKNGNIKKVNDNINNIVENGYSLASNHTDEEILEFQINDRVTKNKCIGINLFNIVKYMNYNKEEYIKIINDPNMPHKKIYEMAPIFGLAGNHKINITDIYDNTEKLYVNNEEISNNILKKINYHVIKQNKKKVGYIDDFMIVDDINILNKYYALLYKKDKTIGESYNILNNLTKISQSVQNSFIGIKYDGNKIINGMIYIYPKVSILSPNIYLWNDMKKINDNNILDIPNDLICVEFSSFHFESVLPKLDINNIVQSNNFVYFCYYLFMNESYEILNIYFPLLASLHKTKNENAKKIIDFILKNKYFHSPYKYYFLNKLNFMINGIYDKSCVRNLLKRDEYYKSIYTKVDTDISLKECSLSDEIAIFDLWQNEIKKYNKNITKKQLLSIVYKLDALIGKKKFQYKYIEINEICQYASILDYVMEESIYKKLFINIQIMMVNKLKFLSGYDQSGFMGGIQYFSSKYFSKEKAKSVITDNDIMGNIKYYIEDTYDHIALSNAPIKLFEIITGKIVDIIQYNFIMDRVNNDVKSQYSVDELLMGRGKTSVIIPCMILIYFFNKMYQNIISCMPSHLISQSSKIINVILPFMTNGYYFILNMNRDSQYDVNYINMELNSITSKLIITNDENIKSYLLMNIEKNKQFGGAYIAINEQISPYIHPITDALQLKRKNKYVNDSSMKDNTIIIMDEFDSLLNPLKADLIFPLDKYRQVDSQNILIKLVLSITYSLFTEYKKYMLESDRSNEKGNKLLIKKIMLDTDSIKYNDLKEFVRKIHQFTKKQFPTVEQFQQLNKDDVEYIKQHVIQSGGSITDHLLLYYVREVYNTYYTNLSLMLDKDYGHDSSSKNPYVVIPYSAQNTPMKGSQYSNIINSIVLTSITYCHKGLRDIDVMEFMKHIKKMFLINKANIHKIIQINVVLITFAINDDNDNFIAHIMKMKQDNYNEYISTICIYLEQIVLEKFVKTNTNTLNCSFIDIINPDFIRAKIALSGTVNVRLPQFEYHDNTDVLRTINKDSITGKQILNALMGINLEKKETSIYIYQNDVFVYMDDTDVLIDTGSFLRYMTNVDVAKKLSIQFKDHYIIYFDEKNKPCVILNSNIINYNLNYLKYEKFYKIYFDQKHTVGTDIELPSTARSMTTINKFNNLTQISQGIFRMREINYYQHNSYLINNDVLSTFKPITDNGLQELYNFLERNEQDVYDKSKSKFLQQEVSCLTKTLLNYNYDSYNINPFVPSLVDDLILKNYDINYVKQHFIKTINDKLQKYNAIDPEKNVIKTKCISLLDDINKSNIEYNDYSVQKQSELSSTMNLEISYETNNKKDMKRDVIFILDIYIYNDFFVNLFCSDNCTLIRPYIGVKYGGSYMNISLVEYMKTINIYLSPHAYSALIMELIKSDNGITLYSYHNPFLNATYVLSAQDVMIINVSAKDNKHINEINTFNGNIVNDLTMLLCMVIPTLEDITKLKQLPQINNQKAIIKDYYSTYYTYNIASIAPDFHNYLG